jgi:hypothetical protein
VAYALRLTADLEAGGRRSSLGWRRSAAACAVTCTTGSARSSPPSRSA